MSKDQQTFRKYFYDGQVKRYLTQFMHVFSGLVTYTGKRENGEVEVLPVPVVYGSRDRVAAAIRSDNTQNAMISLPMMSCYLKEMGFDWERNAGANTYRDTPYLPQGGVLPDDLRMIHQAKPNPYTLQIELQLYTSNMEQQFQVMEQIMMFFNPSLEIQTSDSNHDWTKIVTVELTDINFNENYPSMIDSRVIQTSMQFKLPVWITAPTEIKRNLVQSIYMRMHTGSFEDFVIDSSAGNNDGDYELIASTEGLNVKTT